jgi:hypothetical protein
MEHNCWLSLWVASASMNIVLALVAVGLSVTLSHGAGFHCPAALLRLGQRLGFLFLAGALANYALHTIKTEIPPPSYTILMQIGFMWVIAFGALRHYLWQPLIPKGSTWRIRMGHNFLDRGLAVRASDE